MIGLGQLDGGGVNPRRALGKILRDKRGRRRGAGHGLPLDGTGEAKGKRGGDDRRDDGGSRCIYVVERLGTAVTGRDASANGSRRNRRGNGGGCSGCNGCSGVDVGLEMEMMVVLLMVAVLVVALLLVLLVVLLLVLVLVVLVVVFLVVPVILVVFFPVVV